MIGAVARKLFGSANDRRIRSYQPRIDAAQRYWRNTQSMDEMESGRRWPPASPEA